MPAGARDHGGTVSTDLLAGRRPRRLALVVAGVVLLAGCGGEEAPVRPAAGQPYGAGVPVVGDGPVLFETQTWCARTDPVTVTGVHWEQDGGLVVDGFAVRADSPSADRVGLTDGTIDGLGLGDDTPRISAGCAPALGDPALPVDTIVVQLHTADPGRTVWGRTLVVDWQAADGTRGSSSEPVRLAFCPADAGPCDESAIPDG